MALRPRLVGGFLRLDDPRRQNWCPVAASVNSLTTPLLTSFRGLCPFYLVPISPRGPPPPTHHVESTVSPPPSQRIALLGPARRCPFGRPRPLRAQLLCHHKSDLFWSPEPSVEVCHIVGVRGGTAKRHADALDSSRHSVSGLLTRQEAMVRFSSLGCCPNANIRAADVTTVKVPEMAESITEGTLKQWSKRENCRYQTPVSGH